MEPLTNVLSHPVATMQNLVVNVADKILGRVPVSTDPQPLRSETVKMNAVTWHGKGDVHYEQLGKPLLSADDDIILRVTATSICGTDLHPYNGDLPGFKRTDTLGHEFMGLIEEVGPAVQNLRVGDRVVVSAAIICGKCRYCLAEQYDCCDTTNSSKLMEEAYGHRKGGLFGCGHMLGDYPGGLADYVRVPHADYNCLLLPPDVPDDRALYLSDVLCTSLHACRDVKPGDIVGIWGLGTVGLFAARWCQIIGAKRIIGISGTDYRLKLAYEKLGIEVINYHEKDPVRALSEMIPDGIDVAIDATGFRFAKSLTHKIQRALVMETDTPETIIECMRALRKYGKLTLIASYAGWANFFPIGFMFLKQITMTSGVVPVQKLWKYCLEKLRDGSFDPRFIISHYMKLSDAPSVYQMMNNHEDGMIKSFLRPDAVFFGPDNYEKGCAILSLQDTPTGHGQEKSVSYERTTYTHERISS